MGISSRTDSPQATQEVVSRGRRGKTQTSAGCRPQTVAESVQATSAKRSAGPKEAGPREAGNAVNRVELTERMLRREFSFVSSPDFVELSEEEMLAELPPSVRGESSKLNLKSGRIPPFVATLVSGTLLTPVEERHLFRRMNFAKCKANQVRANLQEGKRQPRLVAELQRLTRIAEADQSRLVESNLRLVVSIAKSFTDVASVLAELVSEGNIALLRAVEKFDYSLGNRFSTYATYAVRRAIYRCLIRKRSQQSRFIDSDLVDSTIPTPQPDSGLVHERNLDHLLARLTELLSTLSPREELILRERFGLGLACQGKTFQELGQELGVCKERVRQIQMRALEKLKDLSGNEFDEWFGQGIS